MDEVFWNTLYGTVLGTIAGGMIVAFIAFLFSKNLTASSATYSVIHTIISDEFVDRRQQLIDEYILYDPIKIAKARKHHKNLFRLQTRIINHLNYYDALMISVDNFSLKREVIRTSIWKVIKRDHEIFEVFLTKYSEDNNHDRPMFPNLRKYRNMWG